jgi:hypothetical protein
MAVDDMRGVFVEPTVIVAPFVKRSLERMSAVAVASAVFCLLSGSAVPVFAAGNVSALNAEIAVLQATTTTTINDVNAAFMRIKAETNQNGCALLVGQLEHTKANTTVNWTVSFVASTTPITAFQFDLPVPSSFTVVSVSAGTSSTTAGKSVSANLSNGVERVIIFGLNQTPIPTGPVAVVQLKLASTVPNELCPIQMINPSASNAAGSTVPLCLMNGYVEVP